MGKSIASVAVRSLAGIGFFLLVFFLPAGTWDYWQAWVFLAVITGGLVAAVCYLFGRSPDLLERRLKTREARPEQRLIILLSLPVLLAAFILPGFDRRYGWSRVPVWVSVLAFLCMIGAFYLYFLVMRANQYAGRYTLGHFDLPMRNCTIALDGKVVVRDGVLQGELAL